MFNIHRKMYKEMSCLRGNLIPSSTVNHAEYNPSHLHHFYYLTQWDWALSIHLMFFFSIEIFFLSLCIIYNFHTVTVTSGWICFIFFLIKKGVHYFLKKSFFIRAYWNQIAVLHAFFGNIGSMQFSTIKCM